MNKSLTPKKIKPLLFLLCYLLIVIVPYTKSLFLMLITSIVPTLLDNDLILTLGMYAIPIILAFAFYGRETIDSFSFFQTHPIKKTLYLLLGYVLVIIGNLSISLITNSSQTENQAAIEQSNTQVPLLFSLLLLGVLIPLIEELVFRKILIGDLSQFINEKLCIAISLVSFALIHVNTNIMDASSYMPLAIIITAAYIISGKNLSYALSLHMINNIIGVVLMSS